LQRLLLVGRALWAVRRLFTGTATAAVIETAPPNWRGRAAAVATVVDIGGLGAGPLLAGLLAQYAPSPLHLPFIVHIVLVMLAAVAILIVPETSPRTGGVGLQRLSIASEVRRIFVVAAIAAFAGFAVTGLFTTVAPSFLSQVVGIEDTRSATRSAGPQSESHAGATSSSPTSRSRYR
jgi:MFS family permease